MSAEDHLLALVDQNSSFENDDEVIYSKGAVFNSVDDDEGLVSSQEENSTVLEIQEIKSSEESSVSETDFRDVTPDNDGGVTKRILQEGDGSETPGYNDRVNVCYTGWILSGKNCNKFDGSDGKDGIEFVLGKGNVIKAWDLGVATMKKGEVALFLCQPNYAYGATGRPPTIPPLATLLFEVKLVDWKLEDLSVKKDKGVLRKILLKGEGTSFPNEGAFVKVSLVGYYGDQVFEDREVEFVIGEVCNQDILEIVETALLKFKKFEKSRLFIKSKYAFGTQGKGKDVPPDADIEYEVTLLDFEKAKDVWEMNTDEKWENSVEAKEKGTSFFKAGHMKAALKQFKRIVKYLEKEPGVAEEELESRRQMLLAGYLNVALCHLKLNNHIDAVRVCDKALEIDPGNEKALFRRGQGQIVLHDYEQALEDFEKIVSLFPENKAAYKHIIICQSKINQHREKEKQTFGNMFKKFADEDEEIRKQQQCQTETGVWEGQDCEHCDLNSDYICSTDEDSVVQMLNRQNLSMNECIHN